MIGKYIKVDKQDFFFLGGGDAIKSWHYLYSPSVYYFPEV